MNAAVRMLYGPGPEELAAQLPDIGDGLAAAMVMLSRDPRPDACESMAIQLNGVARMLMQLRGSVLAQSEPQPPRAA